MAKTLLRMSAFVMENISTNDYSEVFSARCLGVLATGRTAYSNAIRTNNSVAPSNYPSHLNAFDGLDTGNIGTNYTNGGAITTAILHGIPASNFDAAFQIGDGTTGCQLTVLIETATNRIRVWRGTSSGTLLYDVTDATKIPSIGSWYPWQIAWKIHNTAGWFYARCNGKEIINSFSAANINTRNTANAQWNRTIWNSQAANSWLCDWGLWDISTDDPATLEGDYRSAVFMPSSDATLQSTPNSGSNGYSRLSQTPNDNDISYTTFTAAGQEDVYGTNSSTAELPDGSAIHGVFVSTIGKATDAGVTTHKAGIKSSSTTTYGATRQYTTSNLGYVDAIPLDPNGGVAWTASAVRAAQIVQNRVS